MQIQVSWKALGAAVLFLLALGLIGRTLLTRSEVRPTPSAPTRAAIAAGTALPSDTAATIATQASTRPTDTPRPKDTATATVRSSATPSIVPTETPTATAPPTLTPVLLPTRAPTPEPIGVTLVAQGFGQLSTSVSYAFVVGNPNQELLSQQSRYQVAIFDGNGIVVATDADVLPPIGPQQQVAIAKIISVPDGVQAGRIDVQIRNGSFVTSPQLPQLPVDNPAFLLNNGDPKITGIIRNPFAKDLLNVPAVGIAYDDSGIIGGGQAVIPFISANNQSPVEIAIATSRTPTRIEIYPLLSYIP